jgi:hypothetical protein
MYLQKKILGPALVIEGNLRYAKKEWHQGGLKYGTSNFPDPMSPEIPFDQTYKNRRCILKRGYCKRRNIAKTVRAG